MYVHLSFIHWSRSRIRMKIRISNQSFGNHKSKETKNATWSVDPSWQRSSLPTQECQAVDPFQIQAPIERMPVIASTITKAPNIMIETIGNRISFPDQFLQLNQTTELQRIYALETFFSKFLHDNRFWILWDYTISKLLSKFLRQFTIVIATIERKIKYDDDNIFGFRVRVCSWFLQKKVHFVCGPFSVTFLAGRKLRVRECFKPRVTIAIAMLSLYDSSVWMKPNWVNIRFHLSNLSSQNPNFRSILNGKTFTFWQIFWAKPLCVFTTFQQNLLCFLNNFLIFSWLSFYISIKNFYFQTKH